MKRARPLLVYFVALGMLVVLVGAAASAFVYFQSSNDARQTATADAKFAATKAADQIASGLDVIRKASTATVANVPALEQVFSNPSACHLSYAPIGAFDTGR